MATYSPERVDYQLGFVEIRGKKACIGDAVSFFSDNYLRDTGEIIDTFDFLKGKGQQAFGKKIEPAAEVLTSRGGVTILYGERLRTAEKIPHSEVKWDIAHGTLGRKINEYLNH